MITKDEDVSQHHNASSLLYFIPTISILVQAYYPTILVLPVHDKCSKWGVNIFHGILTELAVEL